MWLDLSIGHVSAGMKHPAMWLPVLFLPYVILLSALLAQEATPARERRFQGACRVAILLGLLGFSFHLVRLCRDLRGAVQWEVLQRLMRYPPLFAPLAVSGLGMLGRLVPDQHQQPPAGGSA